MTATETGVHGPIDFVILEFSGEQFTGSTAEALLDLIDRGVVRVYDLMLIQKDSDGSVSAVELSDTGVLDGFAEFAGARTGLFGDDDLREAGAAMEPGTVAACILYENTWAIPFVAAARENGGELIASARIPADRVIEALSALDESTR